MPLCEFYITIRAWKVHCVGFMGVEMLFLVGQLIEAHLAADYRASEGALARVNSQMVKHVGEFPEKLSAERVVTRKDSTQFPCLLVFIKLELGELF